MLKNLIYPIVLSGGFGTRLWPLSRTSYPKQYSTLPGRGSSNSLFQDTIFRLNTVLDNILIDERKISHDSILIVANEEHQFIIHDQLREIKNIKNIKFNLILESDNRNTAPSLTLAAFHASNLASHLSDNVDDPILIVTPSDQVIENEINFSKALQNCLKIINDDLSRHTIAVLGIPPTSPETGFGYIKRLCSPGQHEEYEIEKFIEKPDLETAKIFFSDGDYFWNSGMFVMRSSTWLSAIEKLGREIFVNVSASLKKSEVDYLDDVSIVRPNKKLFELASNISIDYAVIEKCQSIGFSLKMVELNAGWNDLGSWDAVWRLGKKDENRNQLTGDVIAINSVDSLICSSSRLVATAGVKNLIIVETSDSVLVSDINNCQQVKDLVSKLETQNRIEKNLHKQISRPWGWFSVLDSGNFFKVKRIQVKPNASLSLQYHRYRAEHWVVVKGMAEITIGNKVSRLTENQSTYIPIGEIHRLSNPGLQPLEIIEIQTGTYLEEDDIVRLEDNYGR